MYPTYQAKLLFSPNDKNSIVADCWYTYPIASEKQYGISGIYISTKYTNIKKISKAFDLVSGVNLFYINYTDGSNGFASSYDASLMHNKSGLFISPQILHSTSPKEQTNVKFNWNISLGITIPMKK